jgi:formamidopyrimidine-DNA glycosylase
MPELPDVTVYIEALEKRLPGARLQQVVLGNPFLLRTAVPPLSAALGRRVRHLRRIGKRIAIGLAPHEGGDAADLADATGVTGATDELWLVLHLMIAGRLHWFDAGRKVSDRASLARFVFDRGTLTLTEAGSKRRASLHVVAGAQSLAQLDPGGLDIFAAEPQAFRARLQLENHTLKRALTDPRLFSGIGNAYSDEILHRAKLSPLALSQKLGAEQIARLLSATRAVLTEWTDRLRTQAGEGFPEGVTAFHSQMAVHGRYRQPCPVCSTPVQRIRYAENETNYCPHCQTEGRVLADRALSRLLKDDWPRTIEELERLRST